MTTRSRGALVAILFTAMVAASVGLTAQPASAADPGPGYDYQGDPHSHLGGYRTPDGAVGYCIDAGKSSPLGGATVDEGVSPRVHGLSDAAMRQLAWVLLHYGNTRNDDIAAAVALVVWGIADSADHEARGGDGFVITRAPAGSRAYILALAVRIRAEARAYVPPAPGEAELTLTLSPDVPTHGTLDVTLEPGAATGSVTLTNAVFSDTQLATRDVADGEHLEFDALTPPGLYEYEVDAEGTFLGGSYTDGTVHVWATSGAQTLASWGRILPVAFDAAASVQVAIPRPKPPTPDLPRVAG